MTLIRIHCLVESFLKKSYPLVAHTLERVIA